MVLTIIYVLGIHSFAKDKIEVFLKIFPLLYIQICLVKALAIGLEN